jgi:hypothetical protein
LTPDRFIVDVMRFYILVFLRAVVPHLKIPDDVIRGWQSNGTSGAEEERV